MTNDGAATGSVIQRCLVILAASFALSGCVSSSSRPIYPADWSGIAAPPGGRACPDLTGTYQAVSEVAPPLAYPPGGLPQETFVIPFGSPEPLPPLGVRLLPWHLAGQFDEASATWRSLEDYAARSARAKEPGWVQIRELPDGTLMVRAGLGAQLLAGVSLVRERQGHWTYRAQRYECEDGGLVVYGAFPPPPQENPTGQRGAVGAKCTFLRAVDGSLVMLEDAYTGVAQGTMLFQKWWRWRPVQAGKPPDAP